MALDVVGAKISAFVISTNGILTRFCQLLALFIIAIGVTKALVIFLKDALFRPQTSEAFQRSRLVMGYSFSLKIDRRLLQSVVMQLPRVSLPSRLQPHLHIRRCREPYRYRLIHLSLADTVGGRNPPKIRLLHQWYPAPRRKMLEDLLRYYQSNRNSLDCLASLEFRELVGDVWQLV